MPCPQLPCPAAQGKGAHLSESRDDMRIAHAARLLANFTHRTGIHAPGDSARRYLWTDAFAVQALLALARATGETQHRDDAFRLVELVHRNLGMHRADDPRSGWISGLPLEDGDRHPTLGGLRIGKPLPERARDALYDGRLEWERDGQYWHYLTRWIDALVACAREERGVAARKRRLGLARELALAMHAAFVFEEWPGGPRRIRWKMSIDLTRPQVDACGLADMLDGLATFGMLDAELRGCGVADAALAAAVAELRAMSDAAPGFATSDALAVGGLLHDAHRLVRLASSGGMPCDLSLGRLLARLLVDIDRGLVAFARSGAMFAPVGRRLGFRELGLAIGLAAVGEMRMGALRAPALAASVVPGTDVLLRHLHLRELLEDTWLDPRAQATECWQEHIDIHEAMLAACLLPECVLGPAAPARLSSSAPL